MSGSPFGGRYSVEARIGRGGMAEVYLATAFGAAGFERQVVVKRLLPSIAAEPGMAGAFLDEARTLARLEHPHVAQVYDVGEGPEGVYLVMEYVNGADLRVVMERGKKAIEPGIAALIVRDVCEALDHGWNRLDGEGVPLKLVHRDVSLSNIMLSMVGAVKLVDFGLAKALTQYDREHTAEGIVKGKWSYVAPEVLKGAQADHRSDVFSAGVVLWELCAGRKLYKPSKNISQVMADREHEAPPLASVQPSVGPELSAIAARALQLDPAQRFGAAEEMAAALDAVVHQRRVRPSQIAGLMASLFDPKRLRTTMAMRAVELAPIDEGSDTVTDPDEARTIPRELRFAPPTEPSSLPVPHPKVKAPIPKPEDPLLEPEEITRVSRPQRHAPPVGVAAAAGVSVPVVAASAPAAEEFAAERGTRITPAPPRRVPLALVVVALAIFSLFAAGALLFLFK